MLVITALDRLALLEPQTGFTFQCIINAVSIIQSENLKTLLQLQQLILPIMNSKSII